MKVKHARGPRIGSPSVLIFGEDENDTKSVRELILAAYPSFPGTIKPLRRPPVYSKDANHQAVINQVARMCDVIRAEMATSEVLCVLVHRDCDAVEPAHLDHAEDIEVAFKSQGFDVTAVTPAWEMEAWLFLWPSAVNAYRPHWNSVSKYANRNVGAIRNAKEEFRRAVRTTPPKRDYRESDAPGIFAKVRELQIIDKPAARSASFGRLRDELAKRLET